MEGMSDWRKSAVPVEIRSPTACQWGGSLRARAVYSGRRDRSDRNRRSSGPAIFWFHGYFLKLINSFFLCCNAFQNFVQAPQEVRVWLTG